ncbi:hypothetical protein FHR33_001509 [Nonomuraea dietziae]|uniref:Uncharacterized protein n=1 Tax=Nonomuraea dietziae TaxID=65515 RepID=A0A7W5YPX2_9ACTN|nr:hypothetical protein [Nonomuraea dietziae]
MSWRALRALRAGERPDHISARFSGDLADVLVVRELGLETWARLSVDLRVGKVIGAAIAPVSTLAYSRDVSPEDERLFGVFAAHRRDRSSALSAMSGADAGWMEENHPLELRDPAALGLERVDQDPRSIVTSPVRYVGLGLTAGAHAPSWPGFAEPDALSQLWETSDQLMRHRTVLGGRLEAQVGGRHGRASGEQKVVRERRCDHRLLQAREGLHAPAARTSGDKGVGRGHHRAAGQHRRPAAPPCAHPTHRLRVHPRNSSGTGIRAIGVRGPRPLERISRRTGPDGRL